MSKQAKKIRQIVKVRLQKRNKIKKARKKTLKEKKYLKKKNKSLLKMQLICWEMSWKNLKAQLRLIRRNKKSSSSNLRELFHNRNKRKYWILLNQVPIKFEGSQWVKLQPHPSWVNSCLLTYSHKRIKVLSTNSLINFSNPKIQHAKTLSSPLVNQDSIRVVSTTALILTQ